MSIERIGCGFAAAIFSFHSFFFGTVNGECLISYFLDFSVGGCLCFFFFCVLRLERSMGGAAF